MHQKRLEHWTLYEHLFFLLRSAPLIVLVMILVAATALATTFLVPEASVAEGMLRIGSIRVYGALERPADVATRIGSYAFRHALAEAAPQSFPRGTARYGLDAKVSEGGNLIHLVSSADTAEAAKALIEIAAQQVIAEHEVVESHLQGTISARLKEIQRQIRETDAELVTTDKGRDGRDSVALFDQDLQRQRLLERLGALKNQELELQLRGDPVVSPGTRLVDGPALRPPTRSKRRRALQGLFAGLGLALAMVYLLAYIRQQRREPEASEQGSGATVAREP